MDDDYEALQTLLGKTVNDRNGKEHPVHFGPINIVCLYFANSYTKECKEFTRLLLESFPKVNKVMELAQVVIVPDFNSEDEYLDFIKPLPWYSIPIYDARIEMLRKKFNVKTSPALLVLNRSGKLLFLNGAQELIEEGPSFLRHYAKTTENTNEYNKVPIESNDDFCQWTQRIGGSHGDTKSFDDYAEIVKSDLIKGNNPRISEIEIWGSNAVFGISITYTNSDGDSKVARHEGTFPGSNTNRKIKLDYDEFVTVVFGSAGSIMDGLGFETNKGQKIYVGGGRGSEFKMKAPAGKKVIAIAGGTNGHLHNVYAIYANI